MNKNFFRLLFSTTLMMCCTVMVNAEDFTVAGIKYSITSATTGELGNAADGNIKTIYELDMSNVKSGEFPPGWIADDNGTIHQYILNDDGSVGNYNWAGNPGGGGARVFTGFTGGDFTKALYWRSLNGAGYATLTYGEQVNDFELSDGTYDSEMPENIQLYLEPGKYQVSLLMAAWKFEGEGEGVYPKFNFMLQNVKGNKTFAMTNDIEAKPCTNESYTLDSHATLSNLFFNIENPGYYMLKFQTYGYKELLLAECKVLKIDKEEPTLDENIITFADANVSSICVANWDTNGDGKLSKEEAAAITDIGGVFKDNALITTFNELEYFTGVKAIPKDAFRQCSGLREITIPTNVENIGNGAFYGCTFLTSVTIPSSVTSIGDFAFEGCSGLTSVSISEGVENIGGHAFESCSNLTSVIVLAKNPPTLNENDLGVEKNVLLYVPNVLAYKNLKWGGFANIRDLDDYKPDAIADIYNAMQGEKSSTYLNGLVQNYLNAINNSDDYAVINKNRVEAIGKLNSVISTYKEIKSAEFGEFAEMRTPRPGTAVKVTKGDDEVILYAPDKVEYIIRK